MELHWGIIGCGNISTDFVNALSLLSEEEHKVVAVATSNSLERAAAFKTKLGLSYATPYGNYNELYSDKSVDVVYVGNWNHQHRETVTACLNAGKHVLCEKPMGMNPKEINEMAECARKNKKFLMEGFWSRFWPAYDQLRTELFVKKSIGDVKMVTASFGCVIEQERLDQFNTPDVGGSGLMSLGCYTVIVS